MTVGYSLAAFEREQDSLNLLNFLHNKHPNIKLMLKNKLTIPSLSLIYLFISVIDNQSLTCETYHKSTYTGLLLNFISFTSFSYDITVIKCLIDRSFKIYKNWKSFHKDVETIKSNLIKNAYPPFLIDKVIKKYLDHKFSSN